MRRPDRVDWQKGKLQGSRDRHDWPRHQRIGTDFRFSASNKDPLNSDRHARNEHSYGIVANGTTVRRHPSEETSFERYDCLRVSRRVSDHVLCPNGDKPRFRDRHRCGKCQRQQIRYEWHRSVQQWNCSRSQWQLFRHEWRRERKRRNERRLWDGRQLWRRQVEPTVGELKAPPPAGLSFGRASRARPVASGCEALP